MRTWEANIRKVTPYTPGEQPNRPKMIKLNTNENPYPPAPGVRTALKDFHTDCLRLYPDPAATELVEALAAYHRVDTSQVFVGVGSDDVLAMSFMTFFNSKKPILFPEISYSFYPVWAEEFGISYQTPALASDFQIVKEDYFVENGGVIFPNPNAPTSLSLPLAEVEEIVQKNQDVVVIVDEAYVDFGADSALPLIDKYDNLLVVRTFSKSRSMAGMRIGYAIGSPILIRYLNDVKYSFNSYTLNLPSIYLGAEVLKDETYFQETLRKIVDTREWAQRELRALGFVFRDSSTNFIFARHQSCPALKLFHALREKHIYVRHFDQDRIREYLRITVGTREEMETLIDFLKQFLDAD